MHVSRPAPLNQISYWFFCLQKLKKQKGEDDVMWYHWRRSVNGAPESNLFQKKTFLAAVCGVDGELAECRHEEDAQWFRWNMRRRGQERQRGSQRFTWLLRQAIWPQRQRSTVTLTCFLDREVIWVTPCTWAENARRLCDVSRNCCSNWLHSSFWGHEAEGSY